MLITVITCVHLQMMKTLNPAKNYTLSSSILKFKPRLSQPGVRSVLLTRPRDEVQRCSDFSFAVLEMMDITPAKKLALMQVN